MHINGHILGIASIVLIGVASGQPFDQHGEPALQLPRDKVDEMTYKLALWINCLQNYKESLTVEPGVKDTAKYNEAVRYCTGLWGQQDAAIQDREYRKLRKYREYFPDERSIIKSIELIKNH
ncbi:hypothetical protein F5Y04DRAFT_286095 [Hypomontagnella monticulosa]|nr:hypothetical protein F5Y04DRAFT_286095 [Hypomontagnella monticulosa]